MFPNYPGDTPFGNKFPQRLRAQRVAYEHSHDELAQILGTSRNAIAKWEAGKKEPSIAGIIRLCNLLDVTADYLIGRVDEL